MLHDSGGSLGANHAFVHRMIGVPFYITNRSIFEVDANAAAACTHITGGCLDGVSDIAGTLNS